MYIEKTLNLLDTKFPNEWHKKTELDIYSPGNLAPFISEVHENLNLSILAGEYINDPHSLFSLSEKFLHITWVDDINSNSPDEIKNAVNLLYHFYSLVSQYTEFSSSLDFSMSEADTTILVPSILTEFRQEVGSKISSMNYDKIKHYSKIFQINLRMAEIDHNLVASVEILNELAAQTVLLNRYDTNEYHYISILLNKAYILFQKVFRVLQHSGHQIKIFDGYSSKNETLLNKKVKYYNHFLEKSGWFNPSDDLTDAARLKIKEAVDKLISNKIIDYIDFKLVLRYINSDNRPEPTHQIVLEVFSKLQLDKGDSTSFFDELSFVKSLLYIKNNQLSYLIKKKKPYDNIHSLYNEIVSMKQNSSVLTYFPNLKYAKYLLALIESFMGKPSYKVDANIEELFLELKDVLKRLETMFFVSQSKRSIPFQAPFNECCQKVTHKGKRVDIFLSSSYCLPLDYTAIKKDIDYTIMKSELLRSRYELQGNFNDVENKLNDAKQQIKDFGKTQIEILSIFAAIVLFVASNIQLFPRFNSLKQALLFNITQAYSLGLFVMLIWFVTRGNVLDLRRDIPWLHVTLLIFFSIITAILIILLFLFPDLPFIEAVPVKMRP